VNTNTTTEKHCNSLTNVLWIHVPKDEQLHEGAIDAFVFQESQLHSIVAAWVCCSFLPLADTSANDTIVDIIIIIKPRVDTQSQLGQLLSIWHIIITAILLSPDKNTASRVHNHKQRTHNA
jgi:hypothetical protein